MSVVSIFSDLATKPARMHYYCRRLLSVTYRLGNMPTSYPALGTRLDNMPVSLFISGKRLSLLMTGGGTTSAQHGTAPLDHGSSTKMA